MVDSGGNMIIQTHLKISKLLYKQYTKQYNIKLHKGSFMYGNIKPDICLEYSKYPHSVDGTLSIVSKLSEEISECKENTKYISKNLGMIIHYVCDYFCLYHSRDYISKSIIKHFIYELRLHFILMRLLLINKTDFNCEKIVPDKNIQIIIFDEQTKYFEKEKSMEKDLTYAISTAGLVLQSIIYYNTEVLRTNKNNTNYYDYKKSVGGVI